MSTRPPTGLKSIPSEHTVPPVAVPSLAVSGGDAPKDVAQGVLSALRPDPHPADGQYPVAWLHITAPPSWSVVPSGRSWCRCGYDRTAMGRTAVLLLVEAHTAHREECPLLHTEGREAV
ncbi:hypothetical protein [Streptomyces sp. NPDC005407]|uniref:hypothetical protein n=1 Tax=Streptomyces sp. NPDC005407 TaxID=3155340 RepID=UPI0033A8D14C